MLLVEFRFGSAVEYVMLSTLPSELERSIISSSSLGPGQVAPLSGGIMAIS